MTTTKIVTSKKSPVTITNEAMGEFSKLLNEQNIPDDHKLRVGVKGGGCAGFSYVIGFDKRKDGDEEFDVNGLTVIMNKAHQLYLAGIEIDYKNGLDARGFIFNNPNASSTCGCGSSFSG